MISIEFQLLIAPLAIGTMNLHFMEGTCTEEGP